MIKPNQNIDSRIKDWVDSRWNNNSIDMWVFAEWQNVITSELNKEIADLARKKSQPANVNICNFPECE